jgi:hypothetical protein
MELPELGEDRFAVSKEYSMHHWPRAADGNGQDGWCLQSEFGLRWAKA